MVNRTVGVCSSCEFDHRTNKYAVIISTNLDTKSLKLYSLFLRILQLTITAIAIYNSLHEIQKNVN